MADETIIKGLDGYLQHFDAAAYLSSNSSVHDGFNRGCAVLLHEMFVTLEPGERLLDVGSGPGLKNVMSASAKFQNITLSDPVPQNRSMLQQYIDDVSEDQRWTEHFKLTAELEGDAQKWPEVRDRMRTRITRVTWCDILQDESLGKNVQPNELYDCVVATLCLCSASSGGDVTTHARAVRNLVSLAKPGGDVIIADVTKHEAIYYNVGDKKFIALHVTEEQVRQSVEAAGCEVLSSMKTHVHTQAPYHAPTIFYVLKARKLQI